MTALTSSDVKAMLTRHYLPENRPPAGILAFEIGSPDGRRNADGLWVPMTVAGGRTIVGHEIKVSRSDIAAELADLTKADAWARYCDRWWLTVSDPKLVEGFDIPEHWGIMAPPSGRRTRSMTIVREAPQLKPIDQAPAFHRVLCWREHRNHERIRELESTVNWRERQVERLEDDLRKARLFGDGETRHHRDVELVNEVVKILRASRDGLRVNYEPLEEASETIANAIIDHQKVEQAANDLRRHMHSLKKTLADAVEPAGYIAERIDAALKEKV